MYPLSISDLYGSYLFYTEEHSITRRMILTWYHFRKRKNKKELSTEAKRLNIYTCNMVSLPPKALKALSCPERGGSEARVRRIEFSDIRALRRKFHCVKRVLFCMAAVVGLLSQISWAVSLWRGIPALVGMVSRVKRLERLMFRVRRIRICGLVCWVHLVESRRRPGTRVWGVTFLIPVLGVGRGPGRSGKTWTSCRARKP